ncbi:MAG: hypothetical protein RL037_2288, partial [Bacteroidota bacterium]
MFVINTSGSSIAKGALCKATGAQGDKIEIGLFSTSDDPKYLVGIATSTIANGADGYVRVVGELRGIDTNAYVVGTELYASSTPGVLSSTIGTP